MQAPAEEFPRRMTAPKTAAELQAILEKNEPVIFTDLASGWERRVSLLKARSHLAQHLLLGNRPTNWRNWRAARKEM